MMPSYSIRRRRAATILPGRLHAAEMGRSAPVYT